MRMLAAMSASPAKTREYIVVVVVFVVVGGWLKTERSREGKKDCRSVWFGFQFPVSILEYVYGQEKKRQRIERGRGEEKNKCRVWCMKRAYARICDGMRKQDKGVRNRRGEIEKNELIWWLIHFISKKSFVWMMEGHSQPRNRRTTKMEGKHKA